MDAVKMDMEQELARPKLELVPDGYEDEEDDGVSDRLGWGIGSPSQLDWALKRVGALEAQISENEMMLHDRIHELEERCTRLNRDAHLGVMFFRRHIETYAQAHREELLGGGKKKSRSFIHGTVGWRKKAAGLEVTDHAAFLGWAKEQPIELGIIRIKEELEMKAAKAHAEAQETLPPGVVERPEVEELLIRADMKEVF